MKDYPFYEAFFGLGPNKTYRIRKAYNFFDVLGDFGGFNESLFLIIGYASLLYSSKIYKASIAEELSYQDRKFSGSTNEINGIIEKINSENSIPLN